MSAFEERVEASVEASMENTVFVDGIVWAESRTACTHRGYDVICAAIGIALPGPIRIMPRHDQRTRYMFLMRPSESMPEARARCRAQTEKDAREIISWNIARERGASP